MELFEAVAGFQAGDESKFEQIYTDTYKSVYYFIVKFTGDGNHAHDIAQETYIEAFRHLNTLKDPKALLSWLFQIAANKSKRYMRKQNAQPAPMTQEQEGLYQNTPDPNEGLLPAHMIEDGETRRLLMGLIDSLPEEQRKTVMMFYFSEMPVEQIAAEMACSTGTVKSRLNYARQKLKNSILAFEKKEGVRLHSFVPVSVLFTYSVKKMPNILIPKLKWSKLAASASGAGGKMAVKGANGAKSTSTAGSSGGKTGFLTGAKVKAGSSAAAKFGLFSSLQAKVIGVVVASALAIGGGVEAVRYTERNRSQLPETELIQQEQSQTELLYMEDEPFIYEMSADEEALLKAEMKLPYYSNSGFFELTTERAKAYVELMTDGLNNQGWGKKTKKSGYGGEYYTSRSYAYLCDLSGMGMPYLILFDDEQLLDDFSIYDYNEEGITHIGDFNSLDCRSWWEFHDWGRKMMLGNRGSNGAYTGGRSYYSFTYGTQMPYLDVFWDGLPYEDGSYLFTYSEKGKAEYQKLYSKDEADTAFAEVKLFDNKSKLYDEIHKGCKLQDMIVLLNEYIAEVEASGRPEYEYDIVHNDEGIIAHAYLRALKSKDKVKFAKLLDFDGDGMIDLLVATEPGISKKGGFTECSVYLITYEGNLDYFEEELSASKYISGFAFSDVSLCQDKHTGTYYIKWSVPVDGGVYIYRSSDSSFSLAAGYNMDIDASAYSYNSNDVSFEEYKSIMNRFGEVEHIWTQKDGYPVGSLVQTILELDSWA